MQKKIITFFTLTAVALTLFIFVLIAVLMIDVRPTGLKDTVIGLATINFAVFDFFKVNMLWYNITDWLSISAIVVALAFAILGLVQLIMRKSIIKVDYQILLLGAIYVLTIGLYVLFEFIVINYRPIILGKDIAASFPSSTVFTVVSVFGSAIVECNRLFRDRKAVRFFTVSVAVAIMVIIIVGRQLSGVHWFTDILAGILLGSFITFLYKTLVLEVEQIITKRKA